MPAGIQIRKAAKTNVPGIQTLLKEWRNTEEIEGNLNEYQVVLKDKKVLGFLRLLPGKDATYLIKALYVTPKAREQRLGRALIFCALEKTKAKRIYVTCVSEMEPFYEKLGFEKIKTFPSEFSEQLLPLLMAYDPSKHHDASFETKPDLIVIDGGKGQLSAALKSRDALGLTIPMIGLAKREEDVFIPGASFPLLIPKDSKASYLLQRIRDEAHRFAITFQKDSRKKHITHSVLDEIPGIGKATKMKLLKKFGSLEKIKQTSAEELTELVGKRLAEKISLFFR